MTLPYQDIIELCAKIAEESQFNFQTLKNNEKFIADVKELGSKFMEMVNFEHLFTQREAEAKENQFLETGEDQEEEKDPFEQIETNSDDDEDYSDQIPSKKKIRLTPK